MLGKNGEPKVSKDIKFELKLSYKINPEKIVLKTDKDGKIWLGNLKNAEYIVIPI